MREFVSIIFPILPIEILHDSRMGKFIQAIGVDINSIRICAGNIKRFYAAIFAKKVLGDLRVKAISL